MRTSDCGLLFSFSLSRHRRCRRCRIPAKFPLFDLATVYSIQGMHKANFKRRTNHFQHACQVSSTWGNTCQSSLLMSTGFAVSTPVYKVSSSTPCSRSIRWTCSTDAPSSRSRRRLLRALAALPAFMLPKIGNARQPPADCLYDSRSGSLVPYTAISSLLRRDVGFAFERCIVVGEVHDNVRTHAAQLAVIDGARHLPDGMPLTVGFEQFYRMHDAYLQQYVDGKISLRRLLQKTQWDNTWGFDAKLYVPIFEYCRVHRIPMVGLNVPIEFVRQVSRVGLDGLSEGLKPFLPDNMDVKNEEHYRHFMRMMGQSDSHDDITDRPAIFNRYYQAQVLWEEWMSQSVAMSLKNRPGTRMVALIGTGHVEGRYGFPDRIEKRCNERPYTVVPRPVPWTNDPGFAMPDISEPEQNVADLIWYTRRTIDLV